MASLPSLGVSSLDLGRTDLRAAPFIFLRPALDFAAPFAWPDKPESDLGYVDTRMVNGHVQEPQHRLQRIALQYRERP